MMSVSLDCPPCGAVLTGENEEEVIVAVQEHAREHHNVELSRDHLLAELRGEDRDEVHRRIGL